MWAGPVVLALPTRANCYLQGVRVLVLSEELLPELALVLGGTGSSSTGSFWSCATPPNIPAEGPTRGPGIKEPCGGGVTSDGDVPLTDLSLLCRVSFLLRLLLGLWLLTSIACRLPWCLHAYTHAQKYLPQSLEDK